MAESEATTNTGDSPDADTSDSEDHFSDAQEDKSSRANSRPAAQHQPAEEEVSSHEERVTLSDIPTPPAESFAIHDQDDEVEDGQVHADDDFDDFEEGAEHDDFGTFDQEPHESHDDLPAWDEQPPVDQSQQGLSTSIPVFDFQVVESAQDIAVASEPYIKALFPATNKESGLEEAQLAEIHRSFLTERSQSLWSQLVAPPPLQPPNWIRSRIRRLFLVSLGVPVDLDEILPASKQKKLVLPSIEAETDPNPSQTSGEMASNGTMQKLKKENVSAVSLSSSPSKNERKRRGPPPPPDLDLNQARRLCNTTDTALRNLPVTELKQHLTTLDDVKQRASTVLEYWLIQRDSANGDKAAFEEVIENLVKHAKKIRK